MHDLIGTFDHQIDSKNRIRFPSKFKLDGKELVFTLGTKHRIFVYPKSEFDALADKIYANAKLSDDKQQEAMSFFFSTSIALEGDAQGRMIIPPMHKKYANIDKDIVFCGGGSRIEIWAKDAHEKFFGNYYDHVDDLYKLLGI